MLDLTKLKALELPTKTVEVTVLGEKQSVTVSALDDEAALRIASAAGDESMTEAEREIAVRRDILRLGVPGITGDDIDLLMRRAGNTVAEIIIHVRELTTEYAAARSAAAGDAEKK